MTQKYSPEQYKPARDGRGRFSPGNTGNPKGRPRKSDDMIGNDESPYVFGKTVRKLNMNGKAVEMTQSEALNHKLFQLAMGGDTRALIHLQKLIDASNKLVAEAPMGVLEWIDCMRAEPDDRKRDRIVERITTIGAMLDALNLAVARKNQKKRR